MLLELGANKELGYNSNIARIVEIAQNMDLIEGFVFKCHSTAASPNLHSRLCFMNKHNDNCSMYLTVYRSQNYEIVLF